MWVAAIYAILVGFVSAGFTGSLWAMAAGQLPGIASLGTRDAWMPLRVLASVLHAPIPLLRWGFARAVRGHPLGVPALLAAAGWCFLQGVFILTAIFGVT